MSRSPIYGVLKDEEDKRDYSARDLVVTAVPLPAEYIVDKKAMIYDQNGYPRCAAYAGAGVKTDEEFLESGIHVEFDADRLYVECKKIDGIPNLPGTYPRIVCKVLQKQGIAISMASSCPFAFLKPKPLPPTPDEIYKNRIEAYYRIEPGSPAEFVKQVIYQFGSILVASYWYNSWNGAKAVFPEPDYAIERHAYRFIGWNGVGFVTANSWGKLLWGKSGISTMPSQMFLDKVLPEGDVWKLVDYVPPKAGAITLTECLNANPPLIACDMRW